MTVCQISALCSTSVVRNCWTSDSAVHGIIHAYIQTSQSATTTHTHTHCTGYNAFYHIHTQKGWRTDLHCDAILCQCDARSPVNVTVSSDMVYERTEGGVKLRNNCASCIINMDGTLTLLVQLICESIPLAAVQTSPGFTVHWLLQNYSSSM